MDYRMVERRHPELVNHTLYSADWYRVYEAAHLRRYPQSDQTTRENFAMLVRMAERREATQ